MRATGCGVAAQPSQAIVEFISTERILKILWTKFLKKIYKAQEVPSHSVSDGSIYCDQA